MMATRNMGVKLLEELRGVLADNGLRFGMEPRDLAVVGSAAPGGPGLLESALPAPLGAFGELLAAAREFRRARTLRGALEEDLGGLADAMGIGERLNDIRARLGDRRSAAVGLVPRRRGLSVCGSHTRQIVDPPRAPLPVGKARDSADARRFPRRHAREGQASREPSKAAGSERRR